MNILITGGTGLVGRYLIKILKEKKHTVRLLTRKKTPNPENFHWNIAEDYIDEAAFENLDAIIHLAGANISKPWTGSYRKELYESRVRSAVLLKKYCLEKNVHLQSFISSSGINYYGTVTSDQILTEESPILKHDFLSQLCVAWESAAEDFEDIARRVVCVRTAMVLAKDGGAFPLLKKTADYHVASALGTGKQWMNWIHAEDLARLYVYALENVSVEGKINAVADDVVTNKVFMKSLAKTSGKTFLPVKIPAFIMKMALGEMSGIILEGTRASNDKIKTLGFRFKYTKLSEALQELVH